MGSITSGTMCPTVISKDLCAAKAFAQETTNTQCQRLQGPPSQGPPQQENQCPSPQGPRLQERASCGNRSPFPSLRLFFSSSSSKLAGFIGRIWPNYKPASQLQLFNFSNDLFSGVLIFL